MPTDRTGQTARTGNGGRKTEAGACQRHAGRCLRLIFVFVGCLMKFLKFFNGETSLAFALFEFLDAFRWILGDPLMRPPFAIDVV